MESSKKQLVIVFFSMDALGHIHPILPVVKELTRRGHKAVVLTTRPLSMESHYRNKGYDFQSVMETPKDLQASSKNSQEALDAIMKPLVEKFRIGLPDSYRFTYQHDGAAGKHCQDMIDNHDLIEAKLRSLKPDLIVIDHIVAVPCTSYVAPKWVRIYSAYPSAIYSALNDDCVAGLGLKVSEMGLEWKNFERSSKGPLRNILRRFWQEKGCQDWPYDLDLSPHSPYLNIHFGIDETRLDRFFKPLPDNWVRFEHTIEGNSESGTEFHIPVELERKPGKLIYFSMGTLVTNDYETINRLLEIMSKSPNKFIVSMGQMHKYIKLFSNMWGDKFLDQRSILPKVDLFITHGGHNSIIEAFYYGVPGLIVLPVFADQFDCAQQINDSGLGVRLNPFKCTDEELLSAIDERLADTETGNRIANISKRMQSNKYHVSMARMVEELASC